VTRSLRLSPDVALPLDAVTQKLAFLGRTGSGKTYAATKLAELFGDAGAQFIALDPVGKWWSLRLSADGKSAGLDVPVFGGLHGDLPLEPLMGARIADLIVDRQLSAVLDVSQFEHNTDKARFAEAFATRLFFRKKSEPSAVHLFVEEAQEFVPQHPQGEEKRMLGAFERLIKLGRNFGIGASLISQRPQEINKKALNQTECLLVFQTTGIHERKAIDAWIADNGIEEDVAALLPSLGTGQARVWSPAWLRVSLTTTIAAKRTFDASATPKVGARKVEVKALTPIDIVEITKSLADAVERAKADDPRELRRRIAELEKAKPKVVEAPSKPPLTDKQASELAEVVKKFDRLMEMLKELGIDARSLDASFTVLRKLLVENGREQRPAVGRQANGAAPVKAVVVAASRTAKSANGVTDDALPKGERAVLTAVAQNPAGAARDQISALTGYKRATRDAYVHRLEQRGYVEAPAGGPVSATEAGVAALGDAFEPLPTGAALARYWLERLPRGERLIFAELIAAGLRGATREALTEATGFKRATRDAYVHRLASKKIVEARAGEPVRVSQTVLEKMEDA
jgi:uncharacterized protein